MLWNVEMLRFEFWTGEIVYSYRFPSRRLYVLTWHQTARKAGLRIQEKISKCATYLADVIPAGHHK